MSWGCAYMEGETLLQARNPGCLTLGLRRLSEAELISSSVFKTALQAWVSRSSYFPATRQHLEVSEWKTLLVTYKSCCRGIVHVVQFDGSEFRSPDSVGW